MKVEDGQDACEITLYGFRWNAANVVRNFSLPDGQICIGVTTDSGKGINIYVSGTGRSLRIFDGKGREWISPQQWAKP